MKKRDEKKENDSKRRRERRERKKMKDRKIKAILFWENEMRKIRTKRKKI